MKNRVHEVSFYVISVEHVEGLPMFFSLQSVHDHREICRRVALWRRTHDGCQDPGRFAGVMNQGCLLRPLSCLLLSAAYDAGMIPIELCSLHSLECLIVSNNKLTGE